MYTTRFLTLAVALSTPALLCADDRVNDKELPGKETSIEPDKRAAIERFLELSQAERLFYAGLMAGFEFGMDPANNPALAAIPGKKLEEIKTEVGELIRERMSWDAIEEEYVMLYDDLYTLEELTAINEVLDTEAMQLFFSRNGSVLSDSIQIGNGHMQEIQPEIIDLTRQILTRP